MILTQFPTSSEEEIQKGIQAMEEVIQDRVDRPAAFIRPGLGAISLYWGAIGKLPGKPYAESSPHERARAFSGGNGVAKIIAKRLWEGSDGEAAARAMVLTLATGHVGPVYGPDQAYRRDLATDAWQATVSLFRFDHEETWLLTGFDKKWFFAVSNG